MSSMAHLIGKRPPKFSFGQGMGVAMQGAGKYFGELALEQKNAEALQSSRNYQDSVREDVRQDALADRDEQRSYAEGQAADKRSLALGDRDEQREYTATLLEDEIQRAAVSDAEGSITDTINVDGVPHIVRMNKAGEIVKDLGPDPDYVTDVNGNVGKLSAGATGASQKKKTEAQAKFELHSQNMDLATERMAKLLGTDYDLRSFKAFGDQVSQAFGSFGNWMASAEGRKYQAYQKIAGESLYKAMSGAAGSDKEAARFYSMFPAPGDNDSMIGIKLGMIDSISNNLKAAAGMSAEDRYDFMQSKIAMTAADAGFDLDNGGMYGEEPRVTQLPDEDQSLFDKYNLPID